MSLLHFQGTSALALDGKGRMTVPTRHRELLDASAKGELTLTKHPSGCLRLYPRPVWEQFREKLVALPMSADGWKRIFLGSAMDVSVDGAGRVLISPELRSAGGLVRDVLLMGMGSYFELWDPVRYAAQEAEVIAQPMPESLANAIF
ncbi:division/cell wall cluster transcriptional repressor MraZ [Piscinibacter sp. SJAQ100]|uniref:Transcriptional regulator MraZ n=1 Tax=Aquariibacter albus TaxID=2759899 RepID=A0A839HKI6_9BURK|nr:division/cell wall cluster transcriptional repressor MraZ [Aquariibacter albus]MBB1162266.1 division/cell wall cluster transcriptional repressor MraZ [Aquariibacter albus]